MSSHNNSIMKLSFSIFTRYRSVADHVNALRRRGERFTILEVGGRGNFLKRFLPQDQITILDVDDSGEENYVKGDGRQLPFKNRSFDLVVSTDVLEHIPPGDRKKYLKEQVRVCKTAIILSGPLYQPDVARLEKKSNDYYRDLTGEEHPWLKEHVNYGLPKAEDIEAIFTKHHLAITKSWNQRIDLWSQMVLIDLLVATAYTLEVEKAFLKLSHHYNSKIFPFDCDPGGYRTIYTAIRGDRVPKTIARKPYQTIDPWVAEKFQQSVFNLLMTIQRHHLGIIKDKDRHISVLSNLLATQESALSAQQDLLKHWEATISAQTSTLLEKEKLIKDQATMIAALEDTQGLRKEALIERQKKEAYQQKLVELEHQFAELNQQLHSIYSSKKWFLITRVASVYSRLIRPVRSARIALRVVRSEGWPGLERKMKQRRYSGSQYPISLPDINAQYRTWLKQHQLTAESITSLQKTMRSFKIQPKISVIVPLYKTPVPILIETVASVREQIYRNWELVMVDDGSESPELAEYLSLLKSQPQYKIISLTKNAGIVQASNTALKHASGQYVAFLDHDDTLTPDALFRVVEYINKFPKADWLYSDEDKIEADGGRCDPYFKSDFAPYFLLSQMYPCHLAVYRRKFVESLGWLRNGYDGSQDYDLALRAAEKTKPVHIPFILYHWRKIDGSAAKAQLEKPYANKTAFAAIRDALKRRKLSGHVEPGLRPGTFRVRYDPPKNAFVSIIIPTRNQVKLLKSCIQSIITKTRHKDYEIIVLDNRSDDPSAIRYLSAVTKDPRIRVEKYDFPFNFSAINNFGAKLAKGDYLLFLNNDTEVINRDWLTSMLELAQLKDVGAVGAKLLYPNNTIQHAGVVLGIGGIAGHSHKYVPKDLPGYFSQKDLIREYSAVTAGCLLIQRKKFEAVGGFDEAYAIAFNDVDFCLRLGQKGYRCLYTPYAELYHYESVSVGQPDTSARNKKHYSKEINLMRSRWGTLLKNDPYYNPNLSLEREDFSLRI